MEQAPAAPARLGPYAIEGLLGEGAMARVYRARAPDGTKVALKVLRAELESEPSIVERFRWEGRVRVTHPNVVKLLDAGAADGRSYLALELLDGESLERRLARGRLRPDEALDIGAAMCSGLSAVHEANLVHRDLKPANVFLCADGTVKLLDFGVARHLRHAVRRTQEGSLLGTPSYLAPEQARGELGIDERADVWAVGAVLHECLAGQPPFERPTLLATIMAILLDAPPSLRELEPPLPEAFALAIERCLAKPQADRWPSAAALGDALLGIGGDDTQVVSMDATDRVLPSLDADEQRIVALVLFVGIRDLEAVRAHVSAARGWFTPILADRALALFGGEGWTGDEADRAMLAALACRPFVGSAGVGAGKVRAAEVGIAGRALADVEAACALANASVVASDIALSLARRPYVQRAVSSAHVEILEPGEALPMAEARTATVGRERELTQLRYAIAATMKHGHAMAVSILGPAGSGKTQLRRELVRMIRAHDGGRMLLGVVPPADTSRGFSLWHAALLRRARFLAEHRGAPRLTGHDVSAPERRMALGHLLSEGRADAVPTSMLEALGELTGVPLALTPGLWTLRSDQILLTERVERAIEAWVAGLLTAGPLAIVLEDLHLADHASLAVVDTILHRHGSAPLLVVGTARSEVGLGIGDPLRRARETLRIRLGPLGAPHLGRIASATAEAGMSAAVLERVIERCDGNPGFVVEIVAALRDAGELHETPTHLPLPLGVEAAVQSRLDHLTPDERECCRRASVFGRPFAAAELEGLGTAPPAGALDGLVRREILARSRVGPGMTYGFRSRLVADVAYRTLTPELRRQLHRRAITVVEGQPCADGLEIAFHTRRATE